MLWILLVSSVLFGLFAYSVYEPMPEYVKDKEFLTFAHALLKIIDAVGKVTELFGLADSELVRRHVFRLTRRPVKNSSDVDFTYSRFGEFKALVASHAKDGRSGTGIVFIHGGGWVLGSPDMYWKFYSELVVKTGVTVFAISYRLAPEHKFPAAFEDCLAATEAVFARAAEFGVDPERIAVAGDSAGGQLAASVVQGLRRRGSQFKPKLQVLLYPITQVANMRTDSYLTHTHAPLLKATDMHNFVSFYLTGSKAAASLFGRNGHVTPSVKSAYELATKQSLPTPEPVQGDGDKSFANQLAPIVTDYRVSPLLGNDLEKLGLPPTHILASEFDPLFDDSILYARRLEKSGVDTKVRAYRTYHGAATLPLDGEQMRKYLVQVFSKEL